LFIAPNPYFEERDEMTATSRPQFNGRTKGLQVAKAFSEAIRGKTIVVTGVNRGGSASQLQRPLYVLTTQDRWSVCHELRHLGITIPCSIQAETDQRSKNILMS